jgi:hypothetical protein
VLLKNAFILMLLCVVVISCNQTGKDNYSLPEKVVLQNNQLYSPFFIEYLFDQSGKYAQLWNDSILNVSGINSVQLETSNSSTSKKEQEKYLFVFSEHHSLKTFNYFNFDLGETPRTKLQFKESVGNTEFFFGEKVKYKNSMLFEVGRTLHLRGRAKGSFDSTLIYPSISNPELIIEKTGNSYLKVNIILSEGEALMNGKKILTNNGYSIENLSPAEINVVYVNSKKFPLKSYLITDNFVQTTLTGEWNYEISSMLTGYTRFINGSAVKKILFNYSNDHLLREVIYNDVVYKVEYNR